MLLLRPGQLHVSSARGLWQPVRAWNVGYHAHPMLTRSFPAHRIGMIPLTKADWSCMRYRLSSAGCMPKACRKLTQLAFASALSESIREPSSKPTKPAGIVRSGFQSCLRSPWTDIAGVAICCCKPRRCLVLTLVCQGPRASIERPI